MRAVVFMSLLIAGVLNGAAFGQRGAEYFFGHILAPCHPGAPKKACEELKAYIRALNSCNTVEASCEQGERVLKALFDGTHRAALPDVLLYLDQRRMPDPNRPELEPDTFKSSRPVLMFRGKNTPYVFGARDVYAFVFSEEKACLGGVVDTEFRSDPNPFTAILTVLGKSLGPAKSDSKDDRKDLSFTWHPLSGNPSKPEMWYAVARAEINVGSSNRMTIYYRQPNAPKKGEKPEEKDDEKSGDEAKDNAGKPKPKAEAKPEPKPKPKRRATPGDGVEDECGPKLVEEGQKGPVHTANFLAANAFFSNSSESLVALGLAIGVTFNAKNTSVASGGSDVAYNGYGLVKFYLGERFRPRLYAGPEFGKNRRASLSAVAGTNLFNDPFSELLLGVSIGHIFENVGVTIGVNSVEGKADTDQGRKERLFLGIDYSF
jgi:hypothetical protein